MPVPGRILCGHPEYSHPAAYSVISYLASMPHAPQLRRVNVLCVHVSARACPDCAELHVCSGNERCRQCARAAGVFAVSSLHACCGL